MKVASTAFSDGAGIPKAYARKGDNRSPPLDWTGVPSNAKSLALIVDDPDAPDPAAPKCCWVHWVAFNIPADKNGLPEGASGSGRFEGKEGLNDWKHSRYEGPQPPKGTHRYFHKLYALDTTLNLHKPTKGQLEEAMKGHVIAKAKCVGTYAAKSA